MAIDTYAAVTLGNQAVGASNPGHDARHVGGASVGDVVIAFDKARVATRSRLQEAIRAALKIIEGGNSLTA